MENKLIRNSISVLLIAVMVMTAFAVPVTFEGEKAYAAEKDASALGTSSKSITGSGGTLDYTVSGTIDNSGATLPASVTYNKTTYFTVVGDGMANYCNPSAPVVSGETVYLPYKMTLYDTQGIDRGSEDLYNYSTPQNYWIRPDKLGTWRLEIIFAKVTFLGGTNTSSTEWTNPVYETKIQNVVSTGPQKKYKLKMNANKGKIGSKKTKSKKVTSYNLYGKLPVPKRGSYNFAGWFSKKKGGSFVTKSTVNVKLKKHSIYAHWVKKNKYATKGMYKAVKGNMSYKDVKRIFGRKHKETTTSNGVTLRVWYAKKRAGGRPTGPVIAFYNGKAVAKGWYSGGSSIPMKNLGETKVVNDTYDVSDLMDIAE